MFEYHFDLLLIIPTYPTCVVKPPRNVAEPATILPAADTFLPDAVTTIAAIPMPREKTMTPADRAFADARAKGDTEDLKLMTAWQKTNTTCVELGSAMGGKEKSHTHLKRTAKDLRAVEVSQSRYTAQEPLPEYLDDSLNAIKGSIKNESVTTDQVTEYNMRIGHHVNSVMNMKEQSENNKALEDVETDIEIMRATLKSRQGHRDTILSTLMKRQQQRDTGRPLDATLDSITTAPKRPAVAAPPEPEAKKLALVRTNTVDANQIRTVFMASLTDALTPGEIDATEREEILDKQEELRISDEEFYKILSGFGWSGRDFHRGRKVSSMSIPLVSSSESATS